MKTKLNLNFLKKEKKLVKIDYTESNVGKYWNLLVVLFFVVFLGGAVFGFIVFTNLNKNLSLDNSLLPKNKVFDKKQEISEVLKYFENKEQNLLKIKNKNNIIDPLL